MQVMENICRWWKIYAGNGKYMQVMVNICRWWEICAGDGKCMQVMENKCGWWKIYAGDGKYMQVMENMHMLVMEKTCRCWKLQYMEAMENIHARNSFSKGLHTFTVFVHLTPHHTSGNSLRLLDQLSVLPTTWHHRSGGEQRAETSVVDFKSCFLFVIWNTQSPLAHMCAIATWTHTWLLKPLCLSQCFSFFTENGALLIRCVCAIWTVATKTWALPELRLISPFRQSKRQD